MTNESTEQTPGSNRVNVISIGTAILLASVVLVGAKWFSSTIDTEINRQSKEIKKVITQLNTVTSRVKVNDERLSTLETEQNNIRQCLKDVIDRINEVRADTKVIREVLDKESTDRPSR